MSEYSAHRAMCYRCHKPAETCLCPAIPIVRNQTHFTVFQHPRERAHPIGTARIARLGLNRCDVHVLGKDGTLGIDERQMPAHAALLYPHARAKDLATIPRDERPQSLIVLDGTWSHARRIYAENPQLRSLPHVALEPAAPSQYRIRKEPKEHFVSTIESIVMALQILEPETEGIDALLGAFTELIDTQIAQRDARFQKPFRRRPRSKQPQPVAGVLRDPSRLVVVYAEAVPMFPESILQWTSIRPTTGETLQAFVAPPADLDFSFALRFMEMNSPCVPAAGTLDELKSVWREFIDESSVVCAWDRGTIRLLRRAGLNLGSVTHLKSSYCNLRGGGCGTLADVIDRESIDFCDAAVVGRAASRLGKAGAVALWLSDRAA